MSGSPRVAVVFATRERPARVTALLRSLEAQTLPADAFEVIAVDDASRDETPKVLAEAKERFDGRMRVVTRARQGGAGAARNAGWRAARAPLVAFTDDDCEATPRWLEEGLSAWREDPQALIQGRTTPQPRELDRVGPFSRTLSVDRLGPFFETCNMFYGRDLLVGLAGFDEETFRGVGGEDTDLAWRAIEAGAVPRFAERAVVYHAIEDLGPAGYLRVALRWSDAMAMYRNEGLRKATLKWPLFWKRSHRHLAIAAAGLAFARWAPPAGVLAAPYARQLVGRWRAADKGRPSLVALYLLHDLLEMGATVRGAVRHRVPVL